MILTTKFYFQLKISTLYGSLAFNVQEFFLAEVGKISLLTDCVCFESTLLEFPSTGFLYVACVHV